MVEMKTPVDRRVQKIIDANVRTQISNYTHVALNGSPPMKTFNE